LEVAACASNDYPDGVFVIELAAVGDPAAVPEAVAAVLGVTQQTGMSLAESVAAALERRSRLLIFDNCEHVLNATADMIEAILAASGTVKIVATSREGLRLNDEQLWPVPSLDINSSAAKLFVERASAVAPAASLDSDTDAVTEICRRLDGIPLAIELAASRLLSMTVIEIRDLLDDRFRLLVGSRRGLERHQTLHHAVQWSYDLLADDEKALLNRCSVFAGGFDLAGAQAVAGSGDKFATLDLLDALVRKSLVVADQSSGRTRFSMLETIRQFAEEQLVHAGQASDTRTAHAHYFAGREADVLALWDGPRQRDAYSWFTDELANLRRIPLGRRPRRPRRRCGDRRLRGIPWHASRTVRAGCMGRRTHRTRADCQTSSPGTALQHGRTVLRSRPEWWRSPLRRRRPRHHRKRTLRRNPV
jgi:predicted ATPase